MDFFNSTLNVKQLIDNNVMILAYHIWYQFLNNESLKELLSVEFQWVETIIRAGSEKIVSKHEVYAEDKRKKEISLAS